MDEIKEEIVSEYYYDIDENSPSVYPDDIHSHIDQKFLYLRNKSELVLLSISEINEITLKHERGNEYRLDVKKRDGSVAFHCYTKDYNYFNSIKDSLNAKCTILEP